MRLLRIQEFHNPKFVLFNNGFDLSVENFKKADSIMKNIEIMSTGVHLFVPLGYNFNLKC